MQRHSVFALVVLWLAAATAASAEEVVETWRSSGSLLKKLDGTSLDRRDGSWWVVDEYTDEFLRLSPEGAELERRPIPFPNFYSWEDLYISPFDGSWWVSAWEEVDDEYSLTSLHLAEDGTELSAGDVVYVDGISQSDGAIWDAYSWIVGYGPHEQAYWSSYLRRYAANGTLLWQTDTWWGGMHVVGFNSDGSAWVLCLHRLLRFSASGELLADIDPPVPPTYPISLAVFPYDGSVYGVGTLVVDGSPQRRAFRMAADGTLVWALEGPRPGPIVVDPANGSAWIGMQGAEPPTLLHLAADGTELWRGEVFSELESLELDPQDGSLWLCDSSDGHQLIHLAVIGEERPRFIDVQMTHWAYNEIGACVEAGVVTGYADGLYHPELPVTRDQMAVYVARALEAPTGEAALADWVPADPKDFPDVPSDHWAYTHIEYCVENSVVAGYGDGNYHPEYEVGRDQMAVYVARALVAPEGDAGLADYVPADPRNFPDVASDFWAYTHIEYCVENGVVEGYEDGYYHPDYVVTRDQMAVYVARAFGLVG